jgi:membrane protease YdiL (CAAX protease family)
MLRHPGGYLQETRHPWPCLVFMLPLLAVYELGVMWLGGAHPETLRNGADTWLRWGLESFGLNQHYCAPAFIIAVFLCWSILRFWDRPKSTVRLGVGMALESILFALGLWALSRSLGPFLEQWDIHLSMGLSQNTMARIVTFVGAGIYEEVLFRLVLFFALVRVLQMLFIPDLAAKLLTIIISAVLFAAAHNVGPYGETYDRYAFVFRMVAGAYFGLLYQFRGFGIAVGAHACYDVVVGVLMVQSSPASP